MSEKRELKINITLSENGQMNIDTNINAIGAIGLMSEAIGQITRDLLQKPEEKE